MSQPAPRVRLRQAVLVAADLDAVERELRDALGLDEPFRDPGVARVRSAQRRVRARRLLSGDRLADSQPDTAAGRYLKRHGGDGGYMVLFDLEDLDSARARAEQEGVRVVWRIDLPDISGTHLHPADMRGAIVSLDSSRPYGTWRWGGPQWTERTGEGAPGRLASITVAVAEPQAAAERWGSVLGVSLVEGSQSTLALDGGAVHFIAAPDDAGEGIVEFGFDGVPALDGARRARRGRRRAPARAGAWR